MYFRRQLIYVLLKICIILPVVFLQCTYIEIPEVSRTHAMVVRRAGGYWVHDLESSNGTSVNNESVTSAPVAISPGDQLRIGPVRFIFRVL